MFQKHQAMSLKKKSKSLGHLTALGAPSPNLGSPKMKKNISVKSFNVSDAVQGKLKFLNNSSSSSANTSLTNGGDAMAAGLATLRELESTDAFARLEGVEDRHFWFRERNLLLSWCAFMVGELN